MQPTLVKKTSSPVCAGMFPQAVHALILLHSWSAVNKLQAPAMAKCAKQKTRRRMKHMPYISSRTRRSRVAGPTPAGMTGRLPGLRAGRASKHQAVTPEPAKSSIFLRVLCVSVVKYLSALVAIPTA